MNRELNSSKISSVSLDQWVLMHPSMEELSSVFLNLDRALKYIHDHGYCIEVFYPTEIEILNDSDSYIQFNKLIELSHDPEVRKRMIQEDIFRSSFIQVGLYSNSLNYLTPEFLKENFESFTTFLPTDSVFYYRGVIERGASVYLCEFVMEKRNRDLQELEKELGEDSSVSEKTLSKQKDDLTNHRINDRIYHQINGLKDAAFISWLFVPTLVLGALVLLSVIAWIFSLFMG